MPHVLLVDQDKILVDLLTRTLQSGTVETHAATSVAEATHILYSWRPDLLIIDPSLPDGLLFVRSVSMRTSIPVIVFTWSGDVREKLLPLGAMKVVPKEAGFNTLLKMINSVLDVEVRFSFRHENIGVLVVDDELEIVDMLSAFLQDRGYRVVQALTGIEALSVLETQTSIDVVLLDVIIPGKGGIDTLKEIMSRDPHPPVIMMSAIADSQIARQAIELGAYDYLLKPFNTEAVEATITACLAHSEYQHQTWWRRHIGKRE